jgi:hypothetical protein|tara:strand:+ start:3121 stop:4176 length:1056 start_codon:yes stop_codon:yes gene_type:complete
MANGIQPQGYYTTAPELGGGKADSFQYLLDPDDPAGAYRRLLQGNLYPSNVGDYSNITSSGALTSGPFNLVPTPEGLAVGAAGLVNPFAGIVARGAQKRSNSDALRTLANAGILEVIKPSEDATGFNKFMGYTTNPSGEYRLSKEVEDAITEQGITPKQYFENQDAEQFGDARGLAKYLDQIAYSTQGNFFTKDLFGNPTPWSKYVDRNGNIKPDALQQWQIFGDNDKKGILADKDFSGDDNNNQGTLEGSGDKDLSSGGGFIGAPFEESSNPQYGFASKKISTGGGIDDLNTNNFSNEGTFREGIVPKDVFAANQERPDYAANIRSNIVKNLANTGQSNYKQGFGFTRGR